MPYSITRYHDFCAGHRVHGHESKCAHLHGHNYRAHFTCKPIEGLDDLGRVIDFSVVKSQLCEWLEENWDHRFLVWKEDPLASYLLEVDDKVWVAPFNPTAENMAKYLVDIVGPEVLGGTGCYLHEVTLDETRKCSATYTEEFV